ncbi:hypothetical protein F5B21DRAFT_509107 [Xylaria acuta]|nr:hypothetical protein F5B21DRAFT_509107 [Xylaria acuta]
MGDNEPYYIYASSAGESPGDNVHVLVKSSSTGTFVAALNDAKVIILSSPPNPTAGLDSTDETIKWVQQLDSAATGSITADDTGNIESFKLQLTQPWSLTFGSANDVLLLGFGPPSDEGDDRIPPPGIDIAGQILTVGLETADVTVPTVRDIFVTAEAGGMTDYVPSELLDTSSRRIAMRLQFKAPSFDLLQEVLETALKGPAIKSTDTILSKDMILAETESGQEPLFQGSIAIGVKCSVEGGGSNDPEV